MRSFVQPVIEAKDLKTPRLIGRAGKAQLIERNANLGSPAERVDCRLDFPDRVPRGIAGAITFRSRWIDPEEVARLVVVITVEHELKDVAVALGHRIAPEESGLNPFCPFRFKHARPDVNSLIVVRESHLGFLSGRLALVWLGLPEVRRRRRGLPYVFVELPVDRNRSAQTHRADGWRRILMNA